MREMPVNQPNDRSQKLATRCNVIAAIATALALVIITAWLVILLF